MKAPYPDRSTSTNTKGKGGASKLGGSGATKSSMPSGGNHSNLGPHESLIDFQPLYVLPDSQRSDLQPEVAAVDQDAATSEQRQKECSVATANAQEDMAPHLYNQDMAPHSHFPDIAPQLGINPVLFPETQVNYPQGMAPPFETGPPPLEETHVWPPIGDRHNISHWPQPHEPFIETGARAIEMQRVQNTPTISMASDMFKNPVAFNEEHRTIDNLDSQQGAVDITGNTSFETTLDPRLLQDERRTCNNEKTRSGAGEGEDGSSRELPDKLVKDTSKPSAQNKGKKRSRDDQALEEAARWQVTDKRVRKKKVRDG
ncbi:hypothetical protein CPC08DRAFT_729320 [Agrocybe pediades]|nr:hypothetical protein CPC08DRAFT_729320 [Agrocybe pediades]